MAKIFWIAEKSGDYMEISAFNNKRKAEEKALELASHFSLGDTEVPKEEDNDDGDEWLYSGMINAKECFVIGRRDGMPFAAGFDSEDAAENDLPYDSAGACFPVKLKGGMGEVYLSSEAEASGNELWVFEDGEIYEKKNHKKITNENKNNKKNMKYVPTFESFIGSQKLNENYTERDFLPLSDSGDYGLGDGASAKWRPVLDYFGVSNLGDLVWLGEYFPEIVEEKGKHVKSFSLDKYEGEDPHGDVDIDIYKWKGMLLASHDDDYRYSGTLVKRKDCVKLAKLLKDDEGLDIY